MDVNSTQSFTLHRYYDLQTSKLPVVNLGTLNYSGLVTDPNNPLVRYNPAAVNIDPVQAPGTTQTHTFNWGGYGAVQAKPQPMQYINDFSYGGPNIDGGEIVILPITDGAAQNLVKTPTSANIHVAKRTVLQSQGETIDTTA